MEQLLKKLGKGKADPASRQQAQTVRSSVKGFAKQRTVSSCVKLCQAVSSMQRQRWMKQDTGLAGIQLLFARPQPGCSKEI